MKLSHLKSLILLPLFVSSAHAQSGVDYTNWLRQVQLPSGVLWDVSVTGEGEILSPLAIDPGGARFELWTIRADPLTVYLLDTKYVGTYVPMADVTIISEDPNTYNATPRTRADRPFIVDVNVTGLLSGDGVPEASKSVKLLRHVQSYGAGGTGDGINRNLATLIDQRTLVNNAIHRLSYAINSIPGADRTKVRGEERFSVFSQADYQAPESQLSSLYIQVWPVADGSISGLTPNQLIRFDLPAITLTLNDLYPDSRTYAQVYKGNPVLGTQGTVVPGSALIVYEAVPQNRVLTVSNWDAALTSDGRWTIELLTATPFGIDRLAYVSFDVDRTIETNGTFTTIE
jgi:hypothetical protein